ncbi:CoA pyrophosphatase [Erythrobacteraceae bacterium CFH 75059]|uniref:CoA pyrophosphatase n=1 Tax=Qipengyuania thermophila TaxID=2509361 RepID=UPI0010220AC7|nr:CoA pyrophosphatase [Qipengyuania thermophila]TCD02260.1 CoA pyrophosphatase [Erythrobacteraceae bacterium CFH 75059]
MTDVHALLSARLAQGWRRPLTGLLDDRRHHAGGPVKPAAVLVAVTERPSPGVLLIHRPMSMRSHAGQVGFPGGRLDPGETVEAAALREAEEELGIALGAVRVVGTADAFHTGTGYLVTPVLGVVPADLPLVPNPAEVERWFEAPLDHLLDPSNHYPRSGVWNGQPRSYLEIVWGGHRIWGVTAAILANLARRLGVEGRISA